MKRQTRVAVTLLAALCLAVLASSPAAASYSLDEAPPAPRLITVNGEAEVKVVPDEVVLTLGVETFDKSLATAKQLNDAVVKRVLALADEMGIDSKRVQTDYISIEPRYYEEYTRRDFVGYYVRKNIVITLNDIAAFEELLSQALEAGVTHVHGIQFRTTELRKYRDEARALAIRAAREKAVALAGELGQEIGEPTSIQEGYAGWGSWYNSWWGGRWGQSLTQNVIQDSGASAPEMDSATAPGQISVTANVTASFELK